MFTSVLERAREIGIYSISIAVTIQLKVIILALIFSVFIGIISGAIPAIQAAKQKPVDSLRYE